MRIDFVIYDIEFLNHSWIWLNDPEIKELTLTPSFTKEQQLSFFNSLNKRTDYKIWGVIADNEKIGVIGLKNITENNAEYFGYIGNKSYWGKGISNEIFKFICEESKKINISYLYLKVSKENTRAIKSYIKSGFTHDSFLNDNLLFMKLNIKN